MSQENVEIFKRAIETWNRDDFDAWIDLSHAEGLEAAGLSE